MPTPTIVLSHGAFADSSSWNAVIAILRANRFPVIAAANPLRGVKIDAAALADVVDSIAGPVVLVGHSYGGTVITRAALDASNVSALVYVAALAPDTGESVGELAGKFPGSTLGEALVPRPLKSGGADLYIDVDKYHAQFAADVPEDAAVLAAIGQRPIIDEALGEGLPGVPAWKSIPSAFIFGDADRNIPVAVHRFLAERASARAVNEVAGASHAVAVSQPAKVAQTIMDAASF
jgi:pimeloyl-ACP methyl ester carboxylesterase